MSKFLMVNNKIYITVLIYEDHHLPYVKIYSPHWEML